MRAEERTKRGRPRPRHSHSAAGTGKTHSIDSNALLRLGGPPETRREPDSCPIDFHIIRKFSTTKTQCEARPSSSFFSIRMGRKKKPLGGTNRRSRRGRKRETAKPPPHFRTRTFVRSGNETKSKEGKESERGWRSFGSRLPSSSISRL